MYKITSCCGVICSDCQYYPQDCTGCPSIEGKAFWLEFTGGLICDIYDCCVNQKNFNHCGQCSLLPCDLYLNSNDPTKSKEENEKILKNQLTFLKSKN